MSLGSGPAAPAPLAPGRTRYRLRQRFRYTYDGRARDLLHRLVVVPPTVHGDQRLRWGAVEVGDPAAQVAWHADRFGNRHCVVRLATVPAVLELSVTVVVDRELPEPVLPAELLGDPDLRAPSALTRPDDALRRLAREAGPGDDLQRADRLCERVAALLAYDHDVTTVRTTAAQALAGGRGVCQDSAHVLLTLCREVGIACRYVSGHLLGQGGTHAWVEVLVPSAGGARAVALDPCHGRRADGRYVTVAVGRDYGDVPPTSGWYSGPARGTLTTERLLTVSVPEQAGAA